MHLYAPPDSSSGVLSGRKTRAMQPKRDGATGGVDTAYAAAIEAGAAPIAVPASREWAVDPDTSQTPREIGGRSRGLPARGSTPAGR
ncbi:hypothetical protein MIC448_260006 [Microbacterium sp. C448]|nr:hypothetical protein MIC448_260006 [Microbacterium sp. C448]